MWISCLSENQVNAMLASTSAPTPAPRISLQEQTILEGLEGLEWIGRVATREHQRRRRRRVLPVSCKLHPSLPAPWRDRRWAHDGEGNLASLNSGGGWNASASATRSPLTTPMFRF
jgi:hypothetical protein